MPIQDEIRSLISSAKLDKALDKFQEWAALNDSELNNQLILLQGRLRSIKRSESLGLLSFSDVNRERNMLINSVINLLDDISVGLYTPVAKSPTKPPQASDKNKVSSNLKTIIFFASNPTDISKLQLEKELVGISSSLQDKQLSFTIYQKWATKANEIQTEIVKRRPTIVHFSGHGITKEYAANKSLGSPYDEESGLILEDMRGNMKVMQTDELKRMFEIFAKYNMKVGIVVLNACYSASQAKAIMPYVDYVVGMTTAVGDEAAITFAKEFYTILGETENVEMAFDLAINSINIDYLKIENMPKLYPRDA